MSPQLIFEAARRGLNRLLEPVNLELGRRSPTTAAAALARLRRRGIVPNTVIDVGAAYGNWSVLCRRFFPDAHYLLVEPLDEFTPFLEGRAELQGAARVHAAAGGSKGTATINVYPDLVGTSLLRDMSRGATNGTARTVPTVTVDEIARQQEAQPPFLLKVDVQGAELAVVAGATETLRRSEVVILEVAVLPSFAAWKTRLDLPSR